MISPKRNRELLAHGFLTLAVLILCAVAVFWLSAIHSNDTPPGQHTLPIERGE